MSKILDRKAPCAFTAALVPAAVASPTWARGVQAPAVARYGDTLSLTRRDDARGWPLVAATAQASANARAHTNAHAAADRLNPAMAAVWGAERFRAWRPPF